MRVNRPLRFAVGYALATAAMLAAAQEAPQTTELETIIVTGTYIKGTAEEAALPVDVITTEDLQKQGSPNMTDLVKSIPSMQGIIGESNQFGVANATGSSNVNLRGLGAPRTLVLMNGRRLAPATSGAVSVDTNLLPLAAIGRIEVLKDGAAATYGSDAIAGVVNFITKENFSGLSLDANYAYIDGSDGDYGANVAWGWQGTVNKFFAAFGYRHRSMLPTTERDWAVRRYSNNPEGGWSGFGSPGTYLSGATFTTRIIDPGCSALGGQYTRTAAGVTTESDAATATECRFQYITYDNLVEDENHYQAFVKYDAEFSPAAVFYLEGLWAMHDVPEEHASPSYAPNQNVPQIAGLPSAAGTATTAPSYFIPYSGTNVANRNPGLVALFPYLSTTQQTAITAGNGVIASGLLWRPFGSGGNPLTGGAQLSSRKFDGFRVSTGLKGDISDAFAYDFAVTYGENHSEISTPDFIVARLGLALRGLGGPSCTGTTPGAAGCLWLNPFSTGFANNPSTGAVNNATFTNGPLNDPTLISWITTPNSYEDTTSLLVVDAVFSGKFGWSMPGGRLGWAAGVQYRENTFERVVTDDLANINVTPCPATPVNPAATCVAQSGALSFFGPFTPTDVSQDLYAVFAELSLPILESLQAQLAVRYEDYGGGVGSTTNPKLSLRYQPIDWLTFRASGGSTFRAPPQTSLAPGSVTNLFFTAQAGGYKPVDTFGNPNLKPEKADTLNAGILVKAGGFASSIDYWKIKFKDALTAEIGTQLITALYSPYVDPNGVTQPHHCSDPDPRYVELRKRFTFDPANGGCASTAPGAQIAANLLRTRANQINAQSDVDVSGLDVSLSYLFNFGGAELTIGADGTYNFEYKLGANYVEGILIDPAQDAIGTRGGRGGTLPQWRGDAYIDLGAGAHNVRWTTRYVDGVEDVRVATFATNQNAKFVGSFVTHDITYRVDLPADLNVAFSVFNVFDRDPPFARLDLSYDPFIANPLGRYYKLSAGIKF